MNIKPFVFSTAVLIFLGAGCVSAIGGPTDDVDLDATPDAGNVPWTAHNSTITNGIDEALLGTWELIEQEVVGRTNPFAGDRVTFRADGTMTTDYANEKTSRLPECVVSGTVGGTFQVDLEINLDVVDAQPAPDLDPSSGAVTSLLYVTRERTNPEVTCPSQTPGFSVTSNSPTLPLGTGRAVMRNGSPVVLYTYEMDDDWKSLVVTQESPSAIYTYKRIQ